MLYAGQTVTDPCGRRMSFAQVWLAKHEDDGSLVQSPKGEGLVGINCLTKIQVALPILLPA